MNPTLLANHWVLFIEISILRLLLTNLKAPASSELDQVRIDGAPHNFCRPAFATGVINGRNEITKCHLPFSMIGFHEVKLSRKLCDGYGVFTL